MSPHNKWNATNNLIRNSKAITTQWKQFFPSSHCRPLSLHSLPQWQTWNSTGRSLEHLHCLRILLGRPISLVSQETPMIANEAAGVSFISHPSCPIVFIISYSCEPLRRQENKKISLSTRRCTQEIIGNKNIQERHILSLELTHLLISTIHIYFGGSQIPHLWNTKCSVCPCTAVGIQILSHKGLICSWKKESLRQSYDHQSPAYGVVGAEIMRGWVVVHHSKASQYVVHTAHFKC